MNSWSVCTLDSLPNMKIILEIIYSKITVGGTTSRKGGDTRYKGDYMIIARDYCIIMKKRQVKKSV